MNERKELIDLNKKKILDELEMKKQKKEIKEQKEKERFVKDLAKLNERYPHIIQSINEEDEDEEEEEINADKKQLNKNDERKYEKVINQQKIESKEEKEQQKSDRIQILKECEGEDDDDEDSKLQDEYAKQQYEQQLQQDLEEQQQEKQNEDDEEEEEEDITYPDPSVQQLGLDYDIHGDDIFSMILNAVESGKQNAPTLEQIMEDYKDRKKSNEIMDINKESQKTSIEAQTVQEVP
ncbi:MAG: hypothetical protein EZS28_025978 [Streblomastix strix]|uniref:Uncharacterized protein n=1 Tax=Streblomastix strix TaxID=222440 RepID=A0A5J4V842_9EUKA|nr:MAG: hypothetical protein EZS28_025978 [Streblomastix strix]